MKRKTFFRSLAAGASVAVAFVQSANAAIDVTTVTTALTDAGTAAGTVGLAALGVYVGIKAYKLIRRAM